MFRSIKKFPVYSHGQEKLYYQLILPSGDMKILTEEDFNDLKSLSTKGKTYEKPKR